MSDFAFLVKFFKRWRNNVNLDGWEGRESLGEVGGGEKYGQI